MSWLKTWRIVPAALAMFLIGFAPPAVSADYVLHGRVSFDAGGTLVQGADASDWSHATVNTLILPGDTLWMDQGGSGELEFAGGTFVRLADGSKADVVALPPSGTIRAWTGSFYVHRLRRSSGSFIIETPAATVQIEESSSVRVDVIGSGATTVTVRWGRANVRTEGGNTVGVNSGRRIWVDPGLLPSEPTPFALQDEDAFDQWNRERTEYLAGGSGSGEAAVTPAQTYITEPVLGVSDLDAYGEWIYVDSRRVWRPTVVVDFVPYRYGYWSNVPAYGNTWVGNYPFSYVTGHYGRWDYNTRYGWYWGYDPVWSPAWVTSFRYGNYYGWTPINFQYRPAYVTNSAYFNIGGVQFSLHSTSYTTFDTLYGNPYRVYGGYHDPGFYNGIHNHGNNVYVFNFNNTGNRNHRGRVPYNDSVQYVRDYNPRRSIRGTTTYASGNVAASDRVSTLERSLDRGSFDRVSRGDMRQVRTNTDGKGRQATVRQTSITQDAPSYTRATRQTPEVASRGRTDSPSDARVNRGNANATGGRTEAPGRERSDDATRGRTETPGRGRSDDATRGRGDDATRGRGDDATRGRTPSRDDNVRIEAPNRRRTTGGDNRGNAQTQTPTRGGRGDGADRGRTQTEAPGRGNARTTDRQDVRDMTPRPVAPGRTAAPRERSNVRVDSPSPSRDTVRQNNPAPTRSYQRQETPAPTRGTVRQNNPAPTRSYQREVAPAPSRSNQRQAAPAPSRSNQRQAAPAPSRSNQRQAAPAPSRSYQRQSAPAPRQNVAPAPSRSNERPSAGSQRGGGNRNNGRRGR